MTSVGETQWRRVIGLTLLLLPGLGLILILIGTVIGMAAAQSVGYFNFSGESGFHWISGADS